MTSAGTHGGRLVDALRDLETYIPDVERDLSLSSRPGAAGPASVPSLPGGTERLSALAAVHVDVTFWVLAVLEGRELAGRVGDSTLERVRYLLVHAEWLGERIGVDDTEVLVKHASRVRSLAALGGVRRIPIGACPVLDCEAGVVFAAIAEGGASSTAPPDLVCDVDSTHRWDEDGYARLAGMLGHGAPKRMTCSAWTAWARGRGERVIEQQVWWWIRSKPVTIGWNGETLDRVRTMEHWIEIRASKATA